MVQSSDIMPFKKHTICMASDFFYPNVGGVEEHIFQLSQCLLSLGHKVIVITHAYGDRVGIRYLTNGLKVYYLPIQPFYNQSVLPTFLAFLPLLRNVFIREKVTIVHGHSAFSTIAHEAMNLGRALGLKAVFTDHSLFGFADVSAIVTNIFLTISLANIHHCICVSYVGKENTVLRAKVEPEKVSVIPNALDTLLFKPDISKRPKDKINVIILSRLQYRKGIDLQPAVIMHICAKYPQVNFMVAGDGPKRSLLEEVRDCVGAERLQLLGALPHSEVHRILVQGHIFLNTSLTEAFCIAICEAVCSGLQVVSTCVGGIPEVLPPHLISLSEPNSASLIEHMENAIEKEIHGTRIDPYTMHEEMRHIYNWEDIARRTEKVYDAIAADKSSSSLVDRAKRFRKCGPFASTFLAFMISLQALVLIFLDWLWPRENIDVAPDFKNKLIRNCAQSIESNSNGIPCQRRKFTEKLPP